MERRPENGNTSSFDTKNREIIERYGIGIPPPPPEVRLGIVAIACREFDNKNFWRLLESVNHQVGVGNGDFEVYIVVNNSRKSALVRDAKYKENQRMLKILNILNNVAQENEEEPVKGITNRERIILHEAISRKVRVYGIDASSFHTSISLGEGHNIRGIARNIGGHIAYARLAQTGSDPIIDFIDGDCFLRANYVREMVVASSNPEARVVVKPVISVNPDLPRYIKHSSHDVSRALYETAKYLRESLLKTRWKFLRLPAISGQQLAVRASVFKDVGGYVVDQGQEDFGFERKIRRKTDEWVILSETELYMSDRRRKDAVDGHSDERMTDGRLDDLNDQMAYMREQLVAIMLEKNQRFSADGQYIRRRAEAFRRERIERLHFLKNATEVIRAAVATFVELGLDRSALRKFLISTGKFSEGLRVKLGVRESEWIAANPAVSHCLRSALELAVLNTSSEDSKISEEKTWMILQTYLPEYFESPPEVEPDYEQVLTQLENGQHIGINFRDYVHLALAQFESTSLGGEILGLSQEKGNQ